VFLLLQPQHYDLLIRILIICSSPFIAHFFTLTRTKAARWLFTTSITVLIATALWNIL
jgi:hypothetical protein